MDIQEDIRGSFLRIIVDGEKPITLDDTTNLSKRLRKLDSFESVFPAGFRLEVTTPGVDQPLVYPFQYKKNINRELNVSFFDGDELKTITGKIIKAGQEKITLSHGDNNVELLSNKLLKSFELLVELILHIPYVFESKFVSCIVVLPFIDW